MNTPTHDRISPTAKFVAYLRTFSDIPYSEDISRICDAEAVFRSLAGEHPDEFLWPATMVEMRFKSVDALIDRYRFPNILEIAAGVSPRGLIRTAADPKLTYIETDLPDMITEKKRIVYDICDYNSRSNWHLLQANATIATELYDATACSAGPISIVNEGLLPYLNIEEKKSIALAIHTILRARGGVWITPDLSSNDRYKALLAIDPSLGRVLKAISGLTGRKMLSNSFESISEAEVFFKEMGFQLTCHKQRDLVPYLSSLSKVKVEPNKLDIMIGRGLIWTMTVSK